MTLNTVRVPKFNNNFIAFGLFGAFAIWLSVLVLGTRGAQAASLGFGNSGSAAGGEAAGLWDDPTETFTDTATETLTPSITPTPSNTDTETPANTLTPSITPTASNTATNSATATPIALAEWRFEEGSGSSAGDSAGYNNVGTISGATYYGTVGKSLLFDGTNDYVNVANHADIGPTTSFTISAWIYPTAAGGGAVRTIVMKGSSPDYRLALNADGYLEFWLNDLVPTRVTGPIPALETWTYVAGVYDEDADQIRLYVNSQLVATHSFAGDVVHNTNALRIGANLSAAQAWKGQLDQIVLYGWALNQTEIFAFFSGFNAPTPTPLSQTHTPTLSLTPVPTSTPTFGPYSLFSDLTAYWKLDESSGTRFNSFAGNGLTDMNTVLSATGVIANAADFELSNSEFLEISDNASLSTGNVDFTIAAWVNLESVATDQIIAAKSNSATIREYQLFYQTSDDHFVFIVFNSGGTAICTANASTFGVPSIATWYFVTAWRDENGGTDTCNISVNNGATNTASETAAQNSADTAANFRLGARDTTEAGFFDGLIDGVGFWKRVLSGDERGSLYNGGAGLAYPFVGSPTTTPTATPTFAIIPTLTEIDQWGTGEDGDITIANGVTKNINAQNLISGRTCADGGDAVAYSVIDLAESSAKLSVSPSIGCLSVGDEVLLINMQGTTTNFANAGSFDFLRVAAIVGDTVVFPNEKSHFYGDNGGDANIGIGAGNQRVMLMRVPNYNNLTINGTLTGNAWNGNLFGLIMFRVNNTLNGTGTISMNGSGYRGGSGGYIQPALGYHTHGGNSGESYSGPPFPSSQRNGGGGAGGFTAPPYISGGGGFGTAGATGNGAGGLTYGDSELSQIWLGSGGGGTEHLGSVSHGGAGGRGGGSVYIYAGQISFTGSMSMKGAAGTCSSNWTGSEWIPHNGTRGGGGSGGAIRLEAESISTGSLTATGANMGCVGSPSGGAGRIALFSWGALSYSSSNPAPYIHGVSSTTTPTPTPSFTPTPPVIPFTLLDNLIGFWELEEGSGLRVDGHSNNDLEDFNTVTNAGGLVGNGADFESGNSEYLRSADNAELSTGNIDFTFATWVKFETVTGTGRIAAKGNFSNQREWGLTLMGNSTLRFGISADGINYSDIVDSAVLSTGTWYYVIVWHDAANDLIGLQINNGTPVTTSTGGDSPADRSGLFYIGSEGAAAATYHDGLIDQAGFWKRMLTADERASLYNGGSGLSYLWIVQAAQPTATPTPSPSPTPTPHAEDWLENDYLYEGDQPHAVTSVQRPGE